MKIMLSVIKKHFVRSLLLTTVMLSLAACANPYIGRRVNYNSPLWCKVGELPYSCTIKTEDFVFNYKIDKATASNEYSIQGTATYTGKGGFNSIAWTSFAGYDGSRFNLFLARNSVIIDVLSLNPLGSDIQRGMSFKKTFKSKPFDGVGITYQVVLKG